MVEGPGYREEQRVAKALYGSTAPRWRRIANGLRGRTKATGNTALLRWQDRTLALMEAGGPLEIDPGTLDTKGPFDFGGVVTGPFSAHPHRLASRRTTFNFGLEYGRVASLVLYALPDVGPARRLGNVALPWNGMVHDFAITERHAVFVICPIKIRMVRALLGWAGISGIFGWYPDAGAQLLVVPLDDLEHPIRIPIDTRFVFHLANAFERDGELAVDLVQYPDADVLGSLSGNSTQERRSRSQLQRLRVDLRGKKLIEDAPLWDHGCEFPVIPPAQLGGSYDALWMIHGSKDARGIVRVDPRDGSAKAWAAERGLLATEPMFVPRSGHEGWIVSLVLDATIPESFFAVLDASDPAAGPIARIWMGQPLHYTYHGVRV